MKLTSKVGNTDVLFTNLGETSPTSSSHIHQIRSKIASPPRRSSKHNQQKQLQPNLDERLRQYSAYELNRVKPKKSSSSKGQSQSGDSCCGEDSSGEFVNPQKWLISTFAFHKSTWYRYLLPESGYRLIFTLTSHRIVFLTRPINSKLQPIEWFVSQFHGPNRL